MRQLMLTLFLLGTAAAGPAVAVEQDIQHWHNVNGMGRIQPQGPSGEVAPKSQGLWYIEIQPRLSLGTARPTVTLMRAALGWEFAKGLTAWAGFGAIPSWDASNSGPGWDVNELRLWQQVQYVEKNGPLQLLWRGRLEQRAFTGLDDVGLRARVLMRASYDLPVLDRRLALLAWDEPFVGLVGVEGKSAIGFDQNRLFAGGLVRLVPWAWVECGYMNIVLGDPFGANARMLHVVAVATVLNVL
jgi:hypothetical protein